MYVCVSLKHPQAGLRIAPGLRPPERMNQKRDEPNLSYRNGISQVLLYGEFTTKTSRKVRYAVSLTERDLTVQKITSAPAGRSKVVFNLRDCVGCRAFKADDNTDVGAYFSAYLYPFKKRWMSSGVTRQRTEQCFRVATGLDPHLNLEEAQRWARVINESSAHQLPQRNGEKANPGPHSIKFSGPKYTPENKRIRLVMTKLMPTFPFPWCHVKSQTTPFLLLYLNSGLHLETE